MVVNDVHRIVHFLVLVLIDGFRLKMRDSPSPCELAEASDAQLSVTPGDSEDLSSRTCSAPSSTPSTMGKKRSRAMPELTVLDTKIDMIVEESSEDGTSETSENGEKQEEGKTKMVRTSNENSNEVPTTSSDHSSNAQKNSSEKGEDYYYVQKGEDPIEEYYKRNKAYLTVTSMSSMYEKSTEMRRLPDYLKQMTSHRRGTMSSKKSASHRSGRSGQSARSRIGLPQMPSDTHSNKFMRSFYFLASKHRKVGFRHLVMLALVTTYTLIGATIFYNIEGPNEKEKTAETSVELMDAIKIIAEDLRLVARSTNDSLEKHVKNAYISLLEIEGKYSGSTFYKLESQPEPKYQWTFGSAFFFSFTVFTTIGYGAIAPVTTLGKACTIAYAFVCIPLTMVVIRDFGQFVLVTLTKLYARLLIKLRAARGYLTTESESISLPIKFCSLLSVSYVLAAAVFIYNYDALSGPANEGIDLFNALYFSFISITTVGFGDVMPSNASFSPVIAIVFFFGLPIMRVVNRVSYVAFENFAFGLLALAEKKIDVRMGGGTKDTTAEVEEGRSQGGRSARSGRPTRVAAMSTDDYSLYGDESDEEEEEDARARNEMMNNFTIRSLATFMKTRSDVYGGDFGRIDHFYLSLHDTLTRFRPSVPPEMIKVQIVELDENRVRGMGSMRVEIPGIKENRAGWLSGKEGIWEGEFDTDQLEMKKMADDNEDEVFPCPLLNKSNEEIVTEHVVRSFKCICQQSGYHVFKNYLIVIQISPSTDGTIYENEEGLTYRRRHGSNKLFNVDQLRMWMDAKPRVMESKDGWMNKMRKMLSFPSRAVVV